jgi:hypothetical protein
MWRAIYSNECVQDSLKAAIASEIITCHWFQDSKGIRVLKYTKA